MRNQSAMAAPDGRPVDLYRILRPAGEPDLIHSVLPSGAEILELGCGAGRLTHALIALGHPVVAVDESPEMLAWVRGAEIICEAIQDLRLQRRFAAVLLASHLVNVADERTRRAFLEACRLHLAPDGCVLIQRLPPDWARGVGEASERDGIRTVLRDVHVDGDLTSAIAEYSAGEQRWVHSFTVRTLDDSAFEQALTEAGLHFESWIDPYRCWAIARRAR